MNTQIRIEAALAVILLLIITGCSSDDQPAENTAKSQATMITVQTVEHISRPEMFVVSGRVEHSDQAVLSFKSGGIVETMRVDEGDRFQAGDLLAALDTTEVTARVINATEVRQQAERDVRRLERLYEDSVATEQQLENAQTALARARAAEQQARFALKHARIVAPFDGLIANRLADEGELVGEGKPVLRIVTDRERRRVKVGVPARFLPSVHIGDTATVNVETAERPITGVVDQIGAVAEPATGNFVVEIVLPARDYLREGLVASVILNGPERLATVLPSSAVVGGDDDIARLFIIENDTALRREVRLYGFTGDSVLLAPELEPGTRVAVDGAGFLHDGDPVEIGETVQ